MGLKSISSKVETTKERNNNRNNEATTTTPTTTIEKKGYTLLVVSLALLLGVTFYAGQMHGGARTSRAVDGGTTRGATMAASLTMMSNDPRQFCYMHTDRASCVAATGPPPFSDVPCIWDMRTYTRLDPCRLYVPRPVAPRKI